MGCIAHQNNTQHLASLLHPVGSWSFLGVMVHRGLPSHLPSKRGLGPPSWLLSLPRAAGQTGTMLQPASWAGAIHTSQQLHHCVCQEQVPLPASGFEGFSLQHYSWKHDQKNDWNICLHTSDILPKAFYFPKGSLCTTHKKVFSLLHRFPDLS